MTTMLEELSNLNDKQKVILKEFREEMKDVLTDQHDDMCLLRFLRARDYNKDDAGSMLRKNIQWRKENGIDTMLTDYEIPEVIRKYMPTRFFGFDKDGRGVRYLKLGKVNFKLIAATISKYDIVKSSIGLYEQDLHMTKVHNEQTGRNADTLIIIQDWEGLSLTHFTSKRVVDAMMDSVKTFEANYPERVYRMVAINVPSFFSVVFSLIKPLLSEVTRKKIIFSDGDNWKEDLANLVGADILPKRLGGTCEDDLLDESDWNFGRNPKLSDTA